MMQNKIKPELLAPAGDLEKLKIAVLYGADAVYIGGEAYSLRAKAKNFDKEAMAEGIRSVSYTHLAYISEVFFGVADITGAYFAGLILCNVTETKSYIASKINITSYMFFTPIFFASMGRCV